MPLIQRSAHLRGLVAGLCLLPAFVFAQRPIAEANATAEAPAMLRTEMPSKIDPAAHYLIYLHGAIVEENGIRPTDPKYGTYEYLEIIKALETKGFFVITESRPKDTDPTDYARKVVEQINRLLKGGAPPNHITVVGASKGAVIAMMASTMLERRDVNFVIMASCNDGLMRTHDIDLHGNVLSIYDMSDEFGRTCQPFFDKATGLNRRKEVELQLGSGHAILYKPLPDWIDLVEQWAKHGS